MNLSLQPAAVWQHFYDLTQVPRPSGHLEKVQQFLLTFAHERNIEATLDSAGNVIMRLPATPGMEHRKGVVLQAHMDMVPQKAPDSTHDFTTDPITPWIDGEWVRAKGTTLGADDGIGVAAILAIMEDTSLRHGPIEALITADEETGMSGAQGLADDALHGSILLNLDTETWGKFVIGAAGGIDITATCSFQPEPTNAEDVAFAVTLKGLRGGHSGLEIHEGRANANKLMVRLVDLAMKQCHARLAEWHGGNMRNAIPFRADVTLVIPAEQASHFCQLVAEQQALFQDEYRGIESAIELTASDVNLPTNVVPIDVQERLVAAIIACHDGVLRMMPAYPDVVETSSNLAIINITPTLADIRILARSSREDMKDVVVEQLRQCFQLAGLTITTDGSYGGWDPNPASPTLRLLCQVYHRLFDEDAHIEVDHAGLECAFFLTKYPHMDIVSFGPTLRSPHTINERLLHQTVEPFYHFLTQALQEIPEE